MGESNISLKSRCRMSLAFFPPPDSFASLYQGRVMHMRMKPKTHRFTYKVFSLLIDLGQLDQAARLSRLFSVGRFNLLSFFEKDHGPRDSASLDHFVRTLLTERGIDLGNGRILLSCYPRVLGYVFNPLSVYFCYDGDQNLLAVLYEVGNTFGEKHIYVAPIEPGQLDASGLKQERDKLFHVSPFLDMKMRYFFRLHPPTDILSIRILEKDEEGPILSATYHGKRCQLSTLTILRLCLALPLVTLKIMAAIHFEALRLWLKGIGIRRWTPPPPLISDDNILSSRLQDEGQSKKHIAS
jgi:uncharacterized protein